MGRIIANFFIAADGVVESPDQWHFPYFDDEMGAAIGADADTTKAFLMGRTLYQEWSSFWPAQPADDPFASFLNDIPKYVLSNSLTEATWTNSTIVPGDGAVAAIGALKDRTDGDITMSGSATTVRWLMAHGLLDVLGLMVHPIAVGKGQRLFAEGTTQPLRLVSCTPFGSGVLHTVYAPSD